MVVEYPALCVVVVLPEIASQFIKKSVEATPPTKNVVVNLIPPDNDCKAQKWRAVAVLEHAPAAATKKAR